MSIVVIGDLHIGSQHCNREGLLAFFDALREDDALVLNGDVCDRYAKGLTDPDQAVLERIARESERRSVTWLQGNHDRAVRVAMAPGIDQRRELELPGGILVTHGHAFNRALLFGRPITRMLRWAYRLRSWVVRDDEDVAAYAKRWPMLYGIIRKSVRRGALAQARMHGATTVICGHSHHAEDTTIDGIRFVNTGAWTESPVYCARVQGKMVTFERADA